MASELFDQIWRKLRQTVMETADPRKRDKNYYARERVMGIVCDYLRDSALPNVTAGDYVWNIGNALYFLLELIFVEAQYKKKKLMLIDLTLLDNTTPNFHGIQTIFYKFQSCFPYDYDFRLTMKAWHEICSYRREYLNRGMVHRGRFKEPPFVEHPREKIRKITEI